MFGLDLFANESDAEPEPMPTADVAADDLFEALRSARRRRVVRAVADLDTVDLGDLTEVVASEEYDCAIVDLTHQERKRVYVSLYQTHLPKLDQLGVVDVADDQEVQAPPATEAAVELLATAVEVTGGQR